MSERRIGKDRRQYDGSESRRVVLVGQLQGKVLELERQVAQLRMACAAARTYLVERGIRSRGTTGRTVVLPMLDQALDATRERPQ